MGSDTSGTMLHWILQPLKNRKKIWMKLGHLTALQSLKLVSPTSLQPSIIIINIHLLDSCFYVAHTVIGGPQ